MSLSNEVRKYTYVDMKLISVFILQDNHRYGRPELYTEIGDVNVAIFPDLVINLDKVFDF